ncbi:MAG TPA: ribosome maturation factor RimP [Methylomirabilota bacterium]|jgi:ribosome maturation factor RimP|nr:ribosome maturation factor RimP [Methylomirabilota bacterium]
MAMGTDLVRLEAAVETVVLPAVQAHGLTLVDLEVRGNGRRLAVRVYVDKPGGVTVGECQDLSYEVGDLIDVANLVPGSYDLEVSSPGLDRELRKDREFRWASGRAVRVWTREPVDGHREISGQLVAVDEGDLTLATLDGSRRVPRNLVTKARLEVEPRGAAGPRRSR